MKLLDLKIEKYKKTDESVEDIKNRIATDFKTDRKEIWIERLQENGLLTIDECPF